MFSAIGTVAVIIKQELLLPFIGGVFVIEALSVILQVGSYKLRKKRIFKMAPLHHHYQKLGYPEAKIVTRFWILGIMLAILTLVTLKIISWNSGISWRRLTCMLERGREFCDCPSLFRLRLPELNGLCGIACGVPNREGVFGVNFGRYVWVPV